MFLSAEVYSKDRILRAHTGSPGANSHTATVVVGKVLGSKLGFTLQVNDSQTLTRSALMLGRGQLDWFPMPTAIPFLICLLYTSPSPRDGLLSRMPSSA